MPEESAHFTTSSPLPTKKSTMSANAKDDDSPRRVTEWLDICHDPCDDPSVSHSVPLVIDVPTTSMREEVHYVPLQNTEREATTPAMKKSRSDGALNKLGAEDDPKSSRACLPPMSKMGMRKSRSVESALNKFGEQRSMTPRRRLDDRPDLTKKQLKVQSLNSRATAHFRAGEYTEALRIYRDALNVARSDFSKCRSTKNKNVDNKVARGREEQSAIFLIKTLNSASLTCWRIGDLGRSSTFLDEAENVAHAMQLNRAAIDENESFQLAKCETGVNRGILQYLNKDFVRAAATFESTLAIQRSALAGSNGTQVSQTLEMLASTYDQLGRVYASTRLHQEALVMKKAALGNDDLSVARTLLSLGHRHAEVGEYDLALAAYHEALQVQRVTLHESHADIGVTLHYIGRVQASMKLYSASLEHLFQANFVYSKANLDASHVVVASLKRDIEGVKKRLQGMH